MSLPPLKANNFTLFFVYACMLSAPQISRLFYNFLPLYTNLHLFTNVIMIACMSEYARKEEKKKERKKRN